ncbi:hypothetical protein JCM3774_006493 [Rhodotorula dairenensis]
MATHKRALPTDADADADLALADPLRPPAARRRILDGSLWSAQSWSRTHDAALQGHYSCVNAVACSPANADGARWIASAGDDKRILLWDHTQTTPRASYTGPTSNVFAVAFAADGKTILSGGNDSVVLAHDLDRPPSSGLGSTSTSPSSAGFRPTQVWLDHDGAVNSISAHPYNPALFITAASDGSLRQFDSRCGGAGGGGGGGGVVGAIFDHVDMTHVQHHPLTPEVFVYSGEGATLGLIDGRTGWGGPTVDSPDVRMASRVAVQKYHARLTRGSGPSQRYSYPAVSSFTLDRTGSIFCATISGHLPTLYELSEPEPLACFASPAPPPPSASLLSSSSSSSTATAPPPPMSFPRGYRNSTTTKHGSFGGSYGGADAAAPGRGLYYAAGSDDFKTYLWEVPDLERLREGRRRVRSTAIGAGDRSGSGGHTAAAAAAEDGVRFLDMQTKGPIAPAVFPALVSPASSILTGHRSVVNTALFHPTLPLLYTAGVEKLIVRHSPATLGANFLATDPSSSDDDIDDDDDPEEAQEGPGGMHPSSSSTPSNQGGAHRGDRRRGRRRRRRQSWHFVPREPEPHLSHPGLEGPSDPADDPHPLPGETEQARDLRLRSEDLRVLQYFDGLVEAEGDDVLWAEVTEEEEDEGDDDDDDADIDEEYLERVREFMDSERSLGPTRRVLDLLYTLEGAHGSDSDEDEEEV